MNLEVLSDKQKLLLPELRQFRNDYYLAGGTALALQIGHRESIDFDLFSPKEIDTNRLASKLDRSKIESVSVKNSEQYTIIYNDVNLTFLYYPFGIKPDTDIADTFRSVNPLTIGSMKAYALGRRSKWKDYVDLYFILQVHPMNKLLENTRKIYGSLFNDRLFLQQLCYFEDVNFSEKIDFLPGKKVADKDIQDELVQIVKGL